MIAEVLLSYLPIADLVLLGRVCHLLRDAVEVQQKARFNINILLKNFVEDCNKFRANLGLYDGFIVGNFVLNFLETSRCRTSRLDLVLKRGYKADLFKQYLCSVEKYDIITDIEVGRAQIIICVMLTCLSGGASGSLAETEFEF